MRLRFGNRTDNLPSDSSPSPSPAARIRKRTRMDEDNDRASDALIDDNHKRARRSDPLVDEDDDYVSTESNSSPESQKNLFQSRARMSPVLEENEDEEEEDYVDQKSVESILAGDVPTSPTGNPDETQNPFWDGGEEDIEGHEHIDVEDETGETHRRYSIEAKGKGKAA